MEQRYGRLARWCMAGYLCFPTLVPGECVLGVCWIRQRRDHHRFNENVCLLSTLSGERRNRIIKVGKWILFRRKTTRWTQEPTNRNALPSLSLTCSKQPQRGQRKKNKINNAHRLFSFLFRPFAFHRVHVQNERDMNLGHLIRSTALHPLSLLSSPPTFGI